MAVDPLGEQRIPEEGRKSIAFTHALQLLIRVTIVAFHRNSHKKDPAQETKEFWWNKLYEELGEAQWEWARNDHERFLEELGDVMVCLVAILIKGGFKFPPPRKSYHNIVEE